MFLKNCVNCYELNGSLRNDEELDKLRANNTTIKGHLAIKNEPEIGPKVTALKNHGDLPSYLCMGKQWE